MIKIKTNNKIIQKLKIYYLFNKSLKKILIITFGLFLTIFTNNTVNANYEGCCSHHLGVGYCHATNIVMCGDNNFSPTCSCNFQTELENINSLIEFFEITLTKQIYSKQRQKSQNIINNYEPAIRKLKTQTDIRGNILSQAKKRLANLENEKENILSEIEEDTKYMLEEAIIEKKKFKKIQELMITSFEIENKVCPQNSFKDKNGECLCYEGFIFSTSTNSCIVDTSCPSNATYSYSENTCICNYGYQFSDDKSFCVLDPTACPLNATYSYSKKECICNVGYEMLHNKKYCVRECIENSVRSADGNCKCKDGYQFSTEGRGKCVLEKEEKPMNEDMKPLLQLIPEETEKKSIEIKPKICPSNATLENKVCVCNSGYTFSLNKKYCIKIPQNAHAVKSKTDVWICDHGFKEIGNFCEKTLVDSITPIIKKETEKEAIKTVKIPTLSKKELAETETHQKKLSEKEKLSIIETKKEKSFFRKFFSWIGF